jgi:hypothetical protein
MTTYYALGIGGSGSRCLEALIYLCAAGLGPKGKLTLVFVDPDRNNYNLSRALRVAELYCSLQGIERGDECGLFGTKIVQTSPRFWSPFGDGQITPTLGNYFQYEVLKNKQQDDAALFDMLYNVEQRKANLTVGFRGRPSIGAAVFGAKVNLDTEEPWRGLSARISEESTNGTVKIFSFGSLFGGTGAAGLPTIPRILCMKKDPGTGAYAGRNPKAFTGACLLLPYFTFPPPRQVARDEVFAQSEYFVLNSKEALRYYANSDCNRLYVLGAADPAEQAAFEIGGEKQANLPSFVEMLGALGSRNFFEEDSSGSRVAILGRSSPGSIGWEDVPEGALVQAKLGQLTRAAFAFVRLFYPYLQELSEVQHTWYWTLPRRRAWYQDLFERRAVSLADAGVQSAIRDQHEFFQYYLTWLRDLHAGNRAGGGFQVRLADASAFQTPESPASLVDEKFGQLLGEGGRATFTLEDLLRRIASLGRFAPPNASGFGYFQRALFDACANEN